MFFKTKAKLAYAFHNQKLFKAHYLFDMNNKTLIHKPEKNNHLFVYKEVFTLYLQGTFDKEIPYNLKDIIAVIKNNFI